MKVIGQLPINKEPVLHTPDGFTHSTFRLDNQTREALFWLCKEFRKTKSEIMRLAVRQWFVKAKAERLGVKVDETSN